MPRAGPRPARAHAGGRPTTRRWSRQVPGPRGSDRQRSRGRRRGGAGKRRRSNRASGCVPRGARRAATLTPRPGRARAGLRLAPRPVDATGRRPDEHPGVRLPGRVWPRGRSMRRAGAPMSIPEFACRAEPGAAAGLRPPSRPAPPGIRAAAARAIPPPAVPARFPGRQDGGGSGTGIPPPAARPGRGARPPTREAGTRAGEPERTQDVGGSGTSM